ncbi:MAG: TRAP transporter small permease subunit [Burkholderiaceae bacterium]
MAALRFLSALGDIILRRLLPALCATMLALMVVFVAYTVVMRTVFLAPPFWGDTLTTFANVWMVMLGFALAVRERSNIAMEAVHQFLSPRARRLLWQLWTALFGIVGLLMLWPGYQAASRILGAYWELGNMPKSVPMMILPIAGALVILGAVLALVEAVRHPQMFEGNEPDPSP